MPTSDEIIELLEEREGGLRSSIQNLEEIARQQQHMVTIIKQSSGRQRGSMPQGIVLGIDEEAAMWAMAKAYRGLSLKDKRALSKAAKQADQVMKEDLNALRKNVTSLTDGKVKKYSKMAVTAPGLILESAIRRSREKGFTLSFPGGCILASAALACGGFAWNSIGLQMVGVFLMVATVEASWLCNRANSSGELKRDRINYLKGSIKIRRKGIENRFPWHITPNAIDNFNIYNEIAITAQTTVREATGHDNDSPKLTQRLAILEKGLASSQNDLRRFQVQLQTNQAQRIFITSTLSGAGKPDVELPEEWQVLSTGELQQNILAALQPKMNTLVRRSVLNAGAETRGEILSESINGSANPSPTLTQEKNQIAGLGGPGQG